MQAGGGVGGGVRCALVVENQYAEGDLAGIMHLQQNGKFVVVPLVRDDEQPAGLQFFGDLALSDERFLNGNFGNITT